MELQKELNDIAELACSNASERDIEAEVVQIFKLIGWPRLKISQDVPLSDKATDRADIVLRLENRACVLVEIKRRGKLNDSENQVRRYCSLLRPNPKIAVLTDGVRWIVYYAASTGLVPLVDAEVNQAGQQIVAALMALSPSHLNQLYDSKVFDYLAIVEQGLAGLSEEAQSVHAANFAATVRTLILDKSVSIAVNTPVAPIKPKPEDKADVSTPVPSPSPPPPNTEPTEYDPASPPFLFYTSIKATFAGENVNDWSSLVRCGITMALKAGHSVSELQQILLTRIEEGERKENGFRPIAGLNVSVQGMDANKAWRDIFTLAQHLGCKVEVVFRYSENDRLLADKRGKSGILRWSP